MKIQNPSHAEIKHFVGKTDFPCVGAKSAAKQDQISVRRYPDMRSPDNDREILAALKRFVEHYRRTNSLFQSLVIEFDTPLNMTELQFEEILWERLGALHRLDQAEWDPRVSSNPHDPGFSFSLFGEAFFIIGMHSRASRKSRRYPLPAMVMNLHDQFERLREDEVYSKMRDVVRERDAAYCGSPNPEVSNFGHVSEARQYSGRDVPENWKCPFHPEK